MKKTLCCLLMMIVLVAITTTAIAEDIDLSGYSIEELQKLQQQITQEIESRSGKTARWFDYGLGAMLPQPVSTDGIALPTKKFFVNDSDSFYATVENATDEDYTNYITAVSQEGFTVDAERSRTMYEAYNSEGYQIRILYFGKSGMSVKAEVPKTSGTLEWPKSEIAALLPVPDSKVGSISWEGSYGFVAYVSYTKEQYDAYANDCAEKGFTVDYSKGDTYYYADNTDGYQLSLSYEGNNTMFVRIDEPESN